ncbi:MAG: prolyl oligopeptidase family serine peptidase [Pirellulales bacterium]|nr:prolyl oligopeptidase family serine peptidase [Pirellulales bacterium]
MRSLGAAVLIAALIAAFQHCHAQSSRAPLAGTRELTISQPLDEAMVDGIGRFAVRALAESEQARDAAWKTGNQSADGDRKTMDERRERFRAMIGAVDERVAADGFEIVARAGGDGVVARSADAGIDVYAVRWPVLEGVYGEGLLLQPRERTAARAIAIPDADWTPEEFVGLAGQPQGRRPIAGLLAAAGIQVLVPVLVSREDEHSGSPLVAYTNLPHREFVYRQAFPLGRHIIGFEVEKIQAAIDEFARLDAEQGAELPVGVVGVGEGGLLSLYAAALDPRIDAAVACGYFQSRSGAWREPIYRNLWGQLKELGDAEVAALVAPRALIVEACSAPQVAGPPPARDGRRACAAPGRIADCRLDDVQREFTRAQKYFARADAEARLSLVVSDNGAGPGGSAEALAALLTELQVPREQPAKAAGFTPTASATRADPSERQARQVRELTDYCQRLARRSAAVRDELWSTADRRSTKDWTASTEALRERIWAQMIGKLPEPTVPPNVRTRPIIDDQAYVGYETVIDVYPDVIAAGILLVPKGMAADERRPAVVCQHGLEGVPLDTIARTGDGYPYYKAFAHELARRGYIVYAPQNPYRGGDRFRVLQRQSNPLGLSLFSYIIRQHERTLDWLATLPNVDRKRIAFYGLSYGGKTAMRVPPLVRPRYAACICSGDFNDWIRKMTSVEDQYSYVFTPEYEMPEWNMAHLASYAELASLLAPRPFMVERGHDDGVAPDEWVAAEFAKVRRHYDRLDAGARAEIEFFNGPHTINGEGTFEFLAKHLRWPE